MDRSHGAAFKRGQLKILVTNIPPKSGEKPFFGGFALFVVKEELHGHIYGLVLGKACAFVERVAAFG